MNGQFNFGDIDPGRYFFSITLGAGGLFAFIAPDDDQANALALNLIHWILQTLIPLCLILLSHATLCRVKHFDDLNPFVKLTISGVLGAILFSPLAVMLDHYFLPNSAANSLTQPALLEELIAVIPPILIFWLAINLPFQLGWALTKTPTQVAPSEKEFATSDSKTTIIGFKQLLPEHLGHNIVYLKSELHYLHVQTTKGHTLILYSLKNAVIELANEQGFQPHRSFWINLNHLERVDKKGREGIAIMSDQKKIPVSRTKLPTLLSMIKK